MGERGGDGAADRERNQGIAGCGLQTIVWAAQQGRPYWLCFC